MKKLMMAIAGAVAASFAASAATAVVGGVTWHYTISDGKAVVGGGDFFTATAVSATTTGDITIPSALGGCPVTSIGDFAFYYCKSITSVTIPSSVKIIGDCAFSGCSGLKSVAIPNGVTSIGSNAFSHCGKLTEVVIPSAVTSIGGYAFSSCGGLASFSVDSSNSEFSSRNGLLCNKAGTIVISGIIGEVTIPSGVISIGSSAFSGLAELASVTIPSSVKSIASDAFNGCIKVKSVVLPEGLESVGDTAFRNCSGLESVAIPSSMKSIGNMAFAGCSGLKSVAISDLSAWCRISFSSSSSNPMTYAEKFYLNDVELTDLVIPVGVTSIGMYAFCSCDGITTVTIPEGVTSIGDYAFYHCSGLTSVTIPSSVMSIGGYAFSACENMERVEVDQGNRCYRVRGGRLETFGGKVIGSWPLSVSVLSSLIRANDPTIMDVIYKIRSINPFVKVRVLAFEDGQRSFAKVVRPETFVDGTGVNVGDAITPNVEHKISWKVSSDWQTKLAKVKFEVLASEGELLPLETMTIPASAQYGKMKISWNAISENQVFDALLWLYADKDPGLALSGGTLKNGLTALASGTQLSGASSYYDEKGNYVGSHWVPNTAAPSYVLQKMGYSLLTGAPLTYANQETRLGLSPSGVRQYGYKIVE